MTPSPDELALLAGVLAAPEDDLPRLVLADKIEERGDKPRADFIRVQCEVARTRADRCLKTGLEIGAWNRLPPPPDTDPHAIHAFVSRCRCPACTLRRREWNLWAKHGSDWRDEPFAAGHAEHAEAMFREFHRGETFDRGAFSWLFAHRAVTFRRGFPWAVRLPLAAFLRHAADLFTRAPVGRVELTDCEPFENVNVWEWYDRRRSADTAADPADVIHPPSELPGELYDLLTGGTDSGQGWRVYDAAGAALDGLSGAGIAAGEATRDPAPT